MYDKRIKDLVSIVVTNYNNELYIEDCLNSLINQTYKNIEIIIIDDCSTDRSRVAIRRWISARTNDEKSRIKYLEMIENVGFSGAVTVGLYLAKGEYIAMQDGDDCSRNDRIEIEVNYLKNNSDIKVIGSNYAVFKKNPDDAILLLNGVLFGIENIKQAYSNGGSPVSYGTTLFRGEVFDEMGGLTRRIEGAEDYEFLAKLSIYGIDNIDLPLYFYREHAKQRSRKYYGNGEYNEEEIDKNERVSKLEDKESILIVLDKFDSGKTENYVLKVASNLIKIGKKVIIIAEDGPYSSEFKKLNCTIYTIDYMSTANKDTSLKDKIIKEIEEIISFENIKLIKVYQLLSGSIAVEAGNKYRIPYTFTTTNAY